MREPIARCRVNGQAEIASHQTLAVQIPQKHAEHRTTSPHRGAVEALAPLGQKLTDNGRRQRVEILKPHICQIHRKRAEMLA